MLDLQRSPSALPDRVAKAVSPLSPPWHLGSNIRRANDRRLDVLSNDAIKAEWCFLAVIALGVASRFAIAAFHPKYDSWPGQWGPALAELLVAIGVGGAVLTGVITHLCQGELTRRTNARLAEALERAADREFETVNVKKHVAWRELDFATAHKLANALANIPPSSVQFEHITGDTEARRFANDFRVVFERLGWQVGFRVSSFNGDTPPGLCIPNAFQEAGRANLANRVQNAFSTAGIKFTPTFTPSPFMTIFDGIILPPPVIPIFIGPRPVSEWAEKLPNRSGIVASE